MKSPGTLMLVFSLLWLISSCANPVAPTGGPTDKQPPQLIVEESAPQMMTNFNGRELRFEFNEFIDLKEPYQQIIITPEPEYRPDYIARGKTFILRFDPREELDSNTTYTIQFGSSIADFTEGNAAETLRYVFSTGDVIDSLTLNVRLVSSPGGQPVTNALVMLYEGQDDSLVYKQKPYYFMRSDSQGTVYLQNLKEGDFTLVALREKNGNYLFDQPSEELIGFFPGGFINTGKVDSILTIPMFYVQTDPLLILAEQVYDGKWNLVSAGDPRRWQWPENRDMFQTTIVEDSLQFWINEAYDQPLLIRSERGDTIYLLDPREDGRVDPTPALRPMGRRIDLYEKGITFLDFNQPVTITDSEGIFGIDSLTVRIQPEKKIVYDSMPKRLWLEFSSKVPDSLVLAEGAITGFRDIPMGERKVPVMFHPKEELSSLVIRINNLDSLGTYWASLTGDNRTIFNNKLSGQKSVEFRISNLPVRRYTLEVYKDLNENGFYDLGNYIRKIWPEPIKRKEINNLRANWDQEVILEFNDQ